MRQKLLILNSHQDDEGTCLAFSKRAKRNFKVRVEWVSNGDSNVDDPSIREAESKTIFTKFLEYRENQLHFYGFSEKDFYAALLNPKNEEYCEKILEEIKTIRKRFHESAPEIVLTNFPDGGHPRHLFTSWLVTNILANQKTMVLGNPKQLYDENIELRIGHLPKSWLPNFDFAKPANLKAIELKNGILKLKKDEREIIEEIYRNLKYYASQRKSNRDLFDT